MANDYNPELWWSLHPNGGGTTSWREIGEKYGFTRNTVKNAALRWARENGKLEAPSTEGASVVPKEAVQMTLGVEVVDPVVLPPDWLEKLYENAKEQARLRMQTEKEECVFHVRIPEKLPIMFVWTADWHLLDAGTDHDLFDEDMRLWMTTPGVYLGLGGDYGNWFSPAVLPRAMPSNVLSSEWAEGIIAWKMRQLLKQTLFYILGNHDLFPAATGWNPIASVYRGTEIPNLGPGGNVFIQFGTKETKWSDVEYKVAARHSFNFNSSVNDTNSMRNLWIQAGCPKIVCTAHLHRPTMHQPTFDGVDTVWVRNGSHKRNDHHAKSKNFQHTRPEAPDQPGIILFPGEDRMIPFRNYREGLPLLRVLRGENEHAAPQA